MATPKKPFSSPTLSDNQKDVTKATVVVQTYVQMILQQADLKLDALPNLPDHQKTARDHANFWNTTVLPNMVKTNSDIIDYANQFQSFYDVLVGYARTIDKADSRKKLVEGLKQLHDNIQTKHAAAQKVVDDLTSFSSKLNTDYRNFEDDVNEAKVKIGGDDGELKSLNDELKTIHSAMKKDIGLMAGGAIATVGGIVMIVIGAIASVPTGGVATVILIGGGVAVVSAGVVMETLGATDYSNQVEEQKRVQEKIKRDNQEILALNGAEGQLNGFESAISDALSATRVLVKSWQTLGSDLKEVIEAIDRVDPSVSGDFIEAELKTANSDWKVALDSAKQLQSNGKVSTKLYSDLQEAFKEMRKG